MLKQLFTIIIKDGRVNLTPKKWLAFISMLMEFTLEGVMLRMRVSLRLLLLVERLVLAMALIFNLLFLGTCLMVVCVK